MPVLEQRREQTDREPSTERLSTGRAGDSRPDRDDRSDPAPLSTGHECPECAGPVLNGPGGYTCFACDWSPDASAGAAAHAFDHPVLRL